MARTILIVDDEEQLRNLISAVLSSADYTVFATENGKEALNLLDLHEFDLIMTDMIMPDMEGTEFINIVKSQKKLPVKIIAMSGSGSESTYFNLALRMGVDATLEKPFSVIGLLEVVGQVMNKMALNTTV